MVIVSRAINGISLNGDEYLLDDTGKIIEFENKETAKDFLRKSGLSESEIDNLYFELLSNGGAKGKC